MRKTATALLFVSTIALGVACVCSRLFSDRVAPVVTVPAGDLTYKEGDSYENLLIGASAYDNKDGDLSKNVRIYDIAVTGNGDEALVTYAVYDNSNNLGKGSKLIKYIGAPEEQVTEEVTTTEAPTTEAPTTEAPTTEAPTTEALTEDGFEDPKMESTGSPVLKLSTHELSVDVDGQFTPLNYVEQIVDDKDTQSDLFRYIHYNDDYNLSSNGTYIISYYCIDSDGNKSNVAKLRLVVGNGSSE